MYVYYSQAHLTCKNELRKIYTNQNQARNLRTYININNTKTILSKTIRNDRKTYKLKCGTKR